MKNFIPCQQLLKDGLEPVELFAYFRHGRLRPIHTDNGKSIVDLERLINEWVSSTFMGITYDRSTIEERLIVPFDCIAKTFLLSSDPTEARQQIDEAKRWLVDSSEVKEIMGATDNDAIVMPVEDGASNVFRREGNSFSITLNGKTTGLVNGKGFACLYYLVCHKGESIHTDDLARVVEPVDPDQLSRAKVNNDYNLEKNQQAGQPRYGKKTQDKNELLDERTLKEYKEHHGKLRSALEEAETNNDLFRIDKAREELEEFENIIVGDLKPDGTTRKLVDENFRTKERITKSIENALNKIEEKAPSIYTHFKKALGPIRTFNLSYAPSEDINWQTE